MHPIPSKVLKTLQKGEFYLSCLLDTNEFACDDFADPADFVHETTGRVALLNYSGTVIAILGTFKVIQIDGDGLLAQGVSIFDAFDQQAETFSFFEMLMTESIYWDFTDKVKKALDCEQDILPLGMLILSRLEIYPQYRGREFGLHALKCLVQRFRMGAGLIVMKPFPLQFEGQPTAEELKASGLDGFTGNIRTCIARLKAHYGRLGFKAIPRTPFRAMSTISKLENVEFERQRFAS